MTQTQFIIIWLAGWLFTGAFKCGKDYGKALTMPPLHLIGMFIWWPCTLGEELREVLEKRK